MSEVTDDLACDWHTVMGSVVLFGQVLIDDPIRYATVAAMSSFILDPMNEPLTTFIVASAMPSLTVFAVALPFATTKTRDVAPCCTIDAVGTRIAFGLVAATTLT